MSRGRRNVKYFVDQHIGELRQSEQRKKNTEDTGPPGTNIALHNEGTTTQMCRDSSVADTWINGRLFDEEEVQRDSETRYTRGGRGATRNP